MNRLTHERCNGIKSGYWSAAKKDELVERLAMYENTGLTPEECRLRLDPTDDDFQSVLICAERYACGRRTYMPGVIIGYITPLLPVLSDRTLAALLRDLNEAVHGCRLGDPTIDAPGWIELYERAKAESWCRAHKSIEESTDD
ncbi:MAG: hypothetical protein J6S14_13515 [Clostridia bacterium]|nr:hypothetical protein [Clostridia bacterium]